jgi:hypothetical protein
MRLTKDDLLGLAAIVALIGTSVGALLWGG